MVPSLDWFHYVHVFHVWENPALAQELQMWLGSAVLSQSTESPTEPAGSRVPSAAQEALGSPGHQGSLMALVYVAASTFSILWVTVLSMFLILQCWLYEFYWFVSYLIPVKIPLISQTESFSYYFT